MHTRPACGHLLHFTRSAQLFRSFTHRGETHAGTPCRRKPATIVFYLQLQQALLLVQPQADDAPAGVGVAHDVCERFLGDAENRHLHRRRQGR